MTRELIEAAKAVLDLLDPNVGSGLRVGAEIGDWLKATDELRAALRATAAAPAADTVAVPVETLRRWSTTGDVVFAKGSLCAPVPLTEIRNLLPPPPAPEPSEELVETWRKEASVLASDLAKSGYDSPHVIGFVKGYVAARRAEWVKSKKGGG